MSFSEQMRSISDSVINSRKITEEEKDYLAHVMRKAADKGNYHIEVDMDADNDAQITAVSMWLNDEGFTIKEPEYHSYQRIIVSANVGTAGVLPNPFISDGTINRKKIDIRWSIDPVTIQGITQTINYL